MNSHPPGNNFALNGSECRGVGPQGYNNGEDSGGRCFDSRNGDGSDGAGSVDFLTTETQDLLTPLFKAAPAANNGQYPDYSLLQYATTPQQKAAIQKWILKHSNQAHTNLSFSIFFAAQKETRRAMRANTVRKPDIKVFQEEDFQGLPLVFFITNFFAA